MNIIKILCLYLCLIPIVALADSDSFPSYEDAPALTSYVSGGTFNNTYYISTTGNDTTGTGTIGSPWATINGARTGGAGTAAAPGDLVYFRGGTYTATVVNSGWRIGYYYYDNDGTSSNYTVFTAYPSETPVFASSADDRISINIRGDYVVVDSLTFSTGSLAYYNSANSVTQNCIFDGTPYDPMGDQLNSGHLYINDYSHYAMIRNNYFASVNGHALKTYSSSGMPTNLIAEYNIFYTGSVSYGLVAFKSAIDTFEIRYNRFEDVGADVISIGSSYSGTHNGINIHHNAFDGCTNSIFTKLGTASTGQVENLSFYSNVVYNASSGDRDMLELNCELEQCLTGATESLGEFYDNVFYDLIDLIDPQTTTDFTNYPDYWNYNSQTSTAIRDTAENENSLSSSSWQGSALIQVSNGITRTGVAGNRFYTIENDSGFVGAGRYGGNIGGFIFSDAPTITGTAVMSGVKMY